MISFKILVKYVLLAYMLILPITPIVFLNIRLDYFVFSLLLAFFPFIKLSFTGLYLFIVPAILTLITSSYFIFSGQSGEISQLFINFFGFFRIFILVMVAFYLLKSRAIQKEKLFVYTIISLSMLVFIAFYQAISPSFNDFLLHYYTSTYNMTLMETIVSRSNYRLTSTIGHPAGVGLVTVILFSISLNYILVKKDLYNLSWQYLFILLMLASLYVGMISGSKVFYVGVIFLIVYIAIERKAFWQ